MNRSFAKFAAIAPVCAVLGLAVLVAGGCHHEEPVTEQVLHGFRTQPPDTQPPPAPVECEVAGTYALTISNQVGEITRLDLAKGDLFGFRQSPEGFEAFAKDQTFPLKNTYAAEYRWRLVNKAE